MHRHSWVFSLAVMVGMGAFLWTLLMSGGPQERPAMPRSPRVDHPALDRAWRHYRRGQMDESLAQWRIGLAAEPAEAWHWYWAAWTAENTGDEAFAHQAWGEALNRYMGEIGEGDEVRVWSRIGWCQSKLGLGDEAGQAWARSLALLEESMVQLGGPPNSWYRMACCRALAGDREGAIDALEMAEQEQSFDAGMVQIDPDLDSIRDDPRAKAVIQKMAKSGIRLRAG